MYTEYIYNNELYHHGIKGMKWGVRRYQNQDGTYTGAGRRRYFKDKSTRYIRDLYKFSKSESKYLYGNRNKLEKETIDTYEKEMHAMRSELRERNAKTALKIGVAVAGTALAIYGAYKLGTDPRAMRIIKSAANKGKDAVSSMLKQPKKFTSDELKSMGISTFKPDTFKPDKISVSKTPISRTKVNIWETDSAQKWLNNNPGTKKAMLLNEKAKYEHKQAQKQLKNMVENANKNKQFGGGKTMTPAQKMVYDRYSGLLKKAKSGPYSNIVEEGNRKRDIELYERILSDLDKKIRGN